MDFRGRNGCLGTAVCHQGSHGRTTENHKLELTSTISLTRKSQRKYKRTNIKLSLKNK